MILEGVAAVMGLDEGLTRLELRFKDGHLLCWWSHDEKNGAYDSLEPFDDRAAHLLEHLAAGAPASDVA